MAEDDTACMSCRVGSPKMRRVNPPLTYVGLGLLGGYVAAFFAGLIFRWPATLETAANRS
jgi:hypothetical protein